MGLDKNSWISVKTELPTEPKMGPPHHKRLWVCTEIYGAMEGFFEDGKFMKDYSCEILNVTHWLELPELPEID